MNQPPLKARGSHVNPPNRFRLPTVTPEPQPSDEGHAVFRDAATTYFADRSRTVVTENDSPDIGFRFSLNPYRGCAHGCSYCYARPTHEYLGLSAGLDFE